MTIRTRLACWYAGILFVSLVVTSSLLYSEFVREPRNHRPIEETTRWEIAEDESDWGEIWRILLWCGVPAGALAVGGGWWLMRRALGPVAALTVAAERITERHLGERLARTGNGDELDRLTEVFNAMTARLDQSFQRIREFTLHASHELKTPLTVLRGELDTWLQDPTLSAPHRERLLGQLDELDRLAQIVDGLTLLTKADAGQVPLAREPVRFDELVRDALADAEILAQPRGVQMRLGDCEALTVPGDRHRLRQLLLNLTDNAIKYNHPGGEVRLALHGVETCAVLVVTNTGPGIPPERLARVFDPFFRGDASHSNIIEGCGLGLSIARWIVGAHCGNIGLTSEPGRLTTVTVTLPLAGSSAEAAPDSPAKR